MSIAGLIPRGQRLPQIPYLRRVPQKNPLHPITKKSYVQIPTVVNMTCNLFFESCSRIGEVSQKSDYKEEISIYRRHV